MDIFKGQNLLEFSNRFKTDEDRKEYIAGIKWDDRFECHKLPTYARAIDRLRASSSCASKVVYLNPPPITFGENILHLYGKNFGVSKLFGQMAILFALLVKQVQIPLVNTFLIRASRLHPTHVPIGGFYARFIKSISVDQLKVLKIIVSSLFLLY